MKIVSRLLIWLPALAGSAFAKFTRAPQVVDSLTKVGFLAHFPLPGLALLEVVCIVLLLVTGYLGGALAAEISTGGPPAAGSLLALIRAGACLKDRTIVGGSTMA